MGPANDDTEADTGFEPDLPDHRHEESFDSIFGDQVSNSDSSPLIESSPRSSFNPDGTNDFYTIFLIVNAALGAGLCNFPKALDAAGGIAVAVLVQLALIVFIVIALYILAYAAEKHSSSTIQEVVGTSVSKLARMITSISVVLYCFGTTVTFLIMIGDQYDRMFSSLVSPDFCQHFYMNRDFTMTLTGLLVILPMCFSEKIDFLRIPSLLGVTAIVYVVGLIIFEYFYGNFVPGPVKHWPTRWTDVFLVVPDICFGYQCHVSAVPIYSCMKNRNMKHFAPVAVIAMAVCCFAYTGAASFGYLTFGANVNPDILVSYPADRPEVIIGILAMALKTIFTYPILLFCGREAMRSAIEDAKAFVVNPSSPLEEGSEPSESAASSPRFNWKLFQRIVVVIVWFVLSLLCAVLVPNITESISILGCLAAYFIFIVPGLCLTCITYRSDPSLLRRINMAKLALGGAFISFGAFLFGVVLTQDIQSLTKAPSSGMIRYYLSLNKLVCEP